MRAGDFIITKTQIPAKLCPIKAVYINVNKDFNKEKKWTTK